MNKLHNLFSNLVIGLTLALVKSLYFIRKPYELREPWQFEGLSLTNLFSKGLKT